MIGHRPGFDRRLHVVLKGENLYRISLRYGLKVEALRRLNKLESGAEIYPGQKLVVRP